VNFERWREQRRNSGRGNSGMWTGNKWGIFLFEHSPYLGLPKLFERLPTKY